MSGVAEVSVPAGKNELNITLNVMSGPTVTQHVTIVGGNFNKKWSGTGNETLANFNLPRERDEVYKVHVEHASGLAGPQPSKVEVNKPDLSQLIGACYVLGYDPSSSDPTVGIVFTWKSD